MDTRPYLVLDTSFIAADISKDGSKALLRNSNFLLGISYLRPIVLTHVISELEHLVFDKLGFKDDKAKKAIDKVKKLTRKPPIFPSNDYTTKYRKIKEEALPIGYKVSKKMGRPDLSDTNYELCTYSFFVTSRADVFLGTMNYPLRRTVEVMNEETLPILREKGLDLKEVRVIADYRELLTLDRELEEKSRISSKTI